MNIMWLSYVNVYNNFKATNVRLVNTLFLTHHIFFKGASVVKKIQCHKNSLHGQDDFTVNVSVLIQLYTLFPNFNIQYKSI